MKSNKFLSISICVIYALIFLYLIYNQINLQKSLDQTKIELSNTKLELSETQNDLSQLGVRYSATVTQLDTFELIYKEEVIKYLEKKCEAKRYSINKLGSRIQETLVGDPLYDTCEEICNFSGKTCFSGFVQQTLDGEFTGHDMVLACNTQFNINEPYEGIVSCICCG